MITKTTHFLFSRPIFDTQDHIKSATQSYHITQTAENTYTMKVCFSGLGPFAINTIDITINLTPRGRNSTAVHFTATTEGKGLIQRWGCKKVLQHIVQQLSN